MLLLCAAIFVVLAAIFLVLAAKKRWCGDFNMVFGILSAIIAFSLVISCTAIWSELANEHIIDKKIQLCIDENAKIEKDVDSIVKQYMDYEQETFDKSRIEYDGDAMTLVSLFPELKSDALVSQQISIYTSNQREIKRLKEEKIDLIKMRWMLYFGTE
jgi:hypothetical protein